MKENKASPKKTSPILKMLNDKKMTGGTIALKLKVDRQCVYKTINGKGKGSRRIRIFIAKTLNTTPSLLWNGLVDSDKLKLEDMKCMNSGTKQ